MTAPFSLAEAVPRPSADFEADALVLARSLLGDYLVHVDAGVVRVGRIVETEAYRGPKDLACHARVGLTKRTRSLLGPAGHAYVYLIYGMYDCFNVVCGGEGQRGHAVLVRAIEPVLGVSLRSDGPGRLTRALGITRALDGAALAPPTLYITEGPRVRGVEKTARVGVGYAGKDADRPWRFFDPHSAHVSRPSAKSVGSGS